jgi:hemolysin activation/secretion protein
MERTESTTNLVAQTPDPNRDRLIQPAPLPTPAPESAPTIQPSPTPTAAPPTQAPETIAVSRIEVVGSTVFGAKQFDPITKPLEGRSVSVEALRQAADAITQLYLNQGYITSRAVLTDQTIANGIVQIQVIEGSLQEIQVEGTRRLKKSYVRQRIQLGSQPPLRQSDLEDQLRLLKTDPLFTNVEASLRPGTQLGKSILVVRVTEANSLSGFVGVDNFSPPSVGSVRMGGGLNFRNVTGFGDELAASYFRTTADGADIFDFSYRVPVNAMNGTLLLRAAPSDNRIIDPDFEDLQIEGETELYEINFRQPIVRNPREELAVSLGFSLQDGQTFLFQNIPFPFGVGPDADGNSKTRVLRFAQDYVKRDPLGAWALRSQFNVGLDVFDATTNDAPIPDGRFFSWQAQVQRVQRFGKNHFVIASGDLQLTPNSLLPSQQFVIGGGQSIRGFRQNARSGDNGFRISIEDRIAILRDAAGIPTVQIVPFLDFGKVWNQSGNPNRLPSQRFLGAAGLGVLYQPIAGLNFRLDYAVPFLKLDDRGNNAQDRGFTFSVYYQF